MPDERHGPGRRRGDWRHRGLVWWRTAAWVMLVGVVMWGFHLTDQANHHTTRETQERIYAICESSNDARQGIQAFVLDIIRNTHPTGPLTLNEQRIVDLATQRFSLLQCPPPTPN